MVSSLTRQFLPGYFQPRLTALISLKRNSKDRHPS
jgi:hypothetical protein